MKPKSTGTKRTASGGLIGKSRSPSARGAVLVRYPYYALCLDNTGNEVSLVMGKAYRVVRPLKGDPSGMLRVIDEDLEDYLYDSRQIVPIELPAKAKARLAAAEALLI
jgi:hypothetical protein